MPVIYKGGAPRRKHKGVKKQNKRAKQECHFEKDTVKSDPKGK